MIVYKWGNPNLLIPHSLSLSHSQHQTSLPPSPTPDAAASLPKPGAFASLPKPRCLSLSPSTAAPLPLSDGAHEAASSCGGGAPLPLGAVALLHSGVAALFPPSLP